MTTAFEEDHTVIRRLLFHVHTRRSLDSRIRPEQIVAFARNNGIACVIVADHDTHLGSHDCARIAGNGGPLFPMAAEYRSSQGELIAAFLSAPITTRDPLGTIEETHAQGGLIILPHPFRGSRLPDAVHARCDVIETFNARSSDSENARAAALAEELGKPFLAGADAHLARELGLVVNEYDDVGASLWTDLLRGVAPNSRLQKTTLRAIRESQMIKAYRRADPILLGKSIIRWLQAPPTRTP